jgi:hypothetical protein
VEKYEAEMRKDQPAFFLEGIIFGSEEAVLMTGELVDEAVRVAPGAPPTNPIGRWYKPWFFKHVLSAARAGKAGSFSFNKGPAWVEIIPIRLVVCILSADRVHSLNMRTTVLYCTVLYCTVLYCTGTGTVLYCTVLYCTVLYCTVHSHCKLTLYTHTVYSHCTHTVHSPCVLLYCTLLYCTLTLCATVLYCTVLYCTVHPPCVLLYCTVLTLYTHLVYYCTVLL